jgi:glycosyltransferase involved in cell wall biosynthesis
MISVLFVAAELAPWKIGGIATVVRKLGNAIAAEGGVKLTILGTVPRDADALPTGYHKQVDFICVKRPREVEPLYHLQLQMRYRSAISEWVQNNPSGIVHFHILPGARAFLAAHAALKMPGKVVLTHHDWQPFEIPYYQHRWAHRSHWWLSRTLLPRFAHFVANSRYIADAVRATYPNAGVSVIPNGIYTRDWLSKGSAVPLEGYPRILHWGILWEKKGVHLLLSAFARMRANGFPDARLYIVGDGPDSAKLRAAALKLGLGAAVNFLGFVDDPRLRGLLHGCDFAVFPAAYEGFGIAIMEAMAAGKAVVTTALGGPRDFISNGYDGVIAEERTDVSLLRSMTQVAADPQLAARIGDSARQTALRYDWSRIAPQYVELYCGMIRTCPAPEALAPEFSMQV